jgi:hypothetical protein
MTSELERRVKRMREDLVSIANAMFEDIIRYAQQDQAAAELTETQKKELYEAVDGCFGLAHDKVNAVIFSDYHP